MSMSFGSGANAGGLLQPGGVQLQQQQQQQQQLQRLLYRMNAEGLQRGSSSLLSLSSLSSLPSGSGLGRQPFYGRSFNFCDNLYEESSLCKDEEESGGIRHAEKKRRLNAAQVRSLERSFETESKLDPERKTQLASDLGLQPRQVAVWFQNRRARWKTKQLERDNLQLKQKYSAIFVENEKLRTQMARLNQLLREAGLREPEKEEEHDKERDQDEQEQDHEQPTITSSDCYCSEGTATFITPQNNNAEEEGDIEIARNNNNNNNKAEDELEQSVSAASFCSDADSNLGHHLLCSNAMDAVQATKNEENQDHNKLDNLLYSDGVVCGDFPYDQWLFSYVRP